jgi:Cu+-exporting ATPase
VKEQKVSYLKFSVSGMTCASCSSHVRKALENTGGVRTAAVNLATEQAQIELDAPVPAETLFHSVKKAGYEIRLETFSFPVTGMTCAACVRHVEKALQKIPGVYSAGVNLNSNKALIRVFEGSIQPGDLALAVKRAGYQLDIRSAAERADDVDKTKASRRRMVQAWSFTLPIMIWMLPHLLFNRHWPNHLIFNLGMILLALPVLLIPGRETLRRGFRALFYGTSNMDTLIALGTTVSFLTGPLAFFIPVANYAAISAMILAFHLTGRFLEESAKGRASQAIRALLDLTPKTARVRREGSVIEIPVELLETGDCMVVRPGEKIPTDGRIISGESTIDESLVTGESQPVYKTTGQATLGSTINLDGFLEIEVTRTGKNTFLAQVIRLIESCQGSKVPVQALADRITAWFVPGILGLAGLTALSWIFIPGVMNSLLETGQFLPWVLTAGGRLTLAVNSVVAVLVIACPCALGLATPTALMVGSGLGARAGIIFRSGTAIQQLRSVKTVVFDKTGTLTLGRPVLTDIIPLGLSNERLLQLAGSLEQGSTHPIARAITDYCRQEKIDLLPFIKFKNFIGQGLEAEIDGQLVRVGSPNFVLPKDQTVSEMAGPTDNLEGEGKTVVLISVAGEVVGLLGLADQEKPEARETIAELRRMAIQTVMMTGDHRRTAEIIGTRLGIEHIISEVLPAGKVEEIKRLQEKFGPLAFVGDGINDAAAISQAEVGLSMGTGTDIAIEASDVTLVRGDLSTIPAAIKLSRATLNKIKQNLFWAFFYNLLMIPLAFSGWLHPLLAEMAMALSSVTVVANANLLQRQKF